MHTSQHSYGFFAVMWLKPRVSQPAPCTCASGIPARADATALMHLYTLQSEAVEGNGAGQRTQQPAPAGSSEGNDAGLDMFRAALLQRQGGGLH